MGVEQLALADKRDQRQRGDQLATPRAAQRQRTQAAGRRRPQADSVRIAAACAGTRTAYTPLALGLTSVSLGVPVS